MGGKTHSGSRVGVMLGKFNVFVAREAGPGLRAPGVSA